MAKRGESHRDLSGLATGHLPRHLDGRALGQPLRQLGQAHLCVGQVCARQGQAQITQPTAQRHEEYRDSEHGRQPDLPPAQLRPERQRIVVQHPGGMSVQPLQQFRPHLGSGRGVASEVIRRCAQGERGVVRLRLSGVHQFVNRLRHPRVSQTQNQTDDCRQCEQGQKQARPGSGLAEKIDHSQHQQRAERHRDSRHPGSAREHPGANGGSLVQFGFKSLGAHFVFVTAE